ncbi:MAG: MFS transporter [Clostridia bacterium]|nr:MFS transporter [Clostridia bacterium]MBQ8513758.1 MFS transporter [Clostridia bacterium]
MNNDIYRNSRFFYILEAAFEYFISILVGGAYLAKLTSYIGLSDSLTGVLTSFVSLGCGFQIIAVFLANRQPVKKWVTALHILNQLFFALIYLLPFFGIPKNVTVALFCVFLLAGHVISNVVHSPKINWFMSLVDDHKRGDFTATKEIVSLIGGIIFTFIIGQVIDRFEAAGEIGTSLIFCGVGIFVLMLLHTVTLICSLEKPAVKKNAKIRELLNDKGLYKVILITVLWNIANYATTPFYGTYQTKELGFSMTFVSVLAALYAICRSLVSKPLGRYADRTSFVQMMNICFGIQVLSFAVNVFTVPANGKIFYTVYYILHAAAMAGINSGAINLIYDYVDHEHRVGALALQSTLSGFTGFFTTLITSRLVDAIQKNGTFLGMQVYAQQVVSAIGVIVVIVILVYLNTAFRGMKSKKE